MNKLEQAARQALEAIGDCSPNKALVKAAYALREALDHIAATGKVIPHFIPVGIVNDHHSITWMEEIVDDQAPIGAILYALQDSVGRNVSFAEEQK